VCARDLLIVVSSNRMILFSSGVQILAHLGVLMALVCCACNYTFLFSKFLGMWVRYRVCYPLHRVVNSTAVN
jgi:hypothetical protein